MRHRHKMYKQDRTVTRHTVLKMFDKTKQRLRVNTDVV